LSVGGSTVFPVDGTSGLPVSVSFNNIQSGLIVSYVGY
jgi:hypothetical protein